MILWRVKVRKPLIVTEATAFPNWKFCGIVIVRWSAREHHMTDGHSLQCSSDEHKQMDQPLAIAHSLPSFPPQSIANLPTGLVPVSVASNPHTPFVPIDFPIYYSHSAHAASPLSTTRYHYQAWVGACESWTWPLPASMSINCGVSPHYYTVQFFRRSRSHLGKNFMSVMCLMFCFWGFWP